MCVAKRWLVKLHWVVILLRLRVFPSRLSKEIGFASIGAQIQLKVKVLRVPIWSGWRLDQVLNIVCISCVVEIYIREGRRTLSTISSLRLQFVIAIRVLRSNRLEATQWLHLILVLHPLVLRRIKLLWPVIYIFIIPSWRHLWLLLLSVVFPLFLLFIIPNTLVHFSLHLVRFEAASFLTLARLKRSKRADPLHAIPLHIQVVLRRLSCVTLLSETARIARVILLAKRLVCGFLHQTGDWILRNARWVLVKLHILAHWEYWRSVVKLWSNTFVPIGRHIIYRVLEQNSSSRWLLGLGVEKAASIVFNCLIEAATHRWSKLHMCSLGAHWWRGILSKVVMLLIFLRFC